MRTVTSEELFCIVETTFSDLPDRKKLLYLRDVASTLTKYTGGRVGKVGVWTVDIHEIGPTNFFKKAFQFIAHHLF